jgi:uncharacterized protein (TIGR00255 family)
MRSMTGYGAASADARAARVSVEIRGVNQRFLDLKVSMPREYAAWETEIRERARALIARGRIEVLVVRLPLAARRRYRVGVREELARAYVGAARGLLRSLRLGGALTLPDVLRLPDLFEVSEQGPELDRELPALRRALAGALRAFDVERRREGAHLRGDMQRRVAALRQAVVRIHRRLPAALEALRERVRERLSRLVAAADLDPERVAHEAAVLADRGDISEELVRLDSHIAALAAVLRAPGPVGKRIEFLLQEIHREINTTGAKSSDLAVTELVLAAKGEVEKLREQVQNVE